MQLKRNKEIEFETLKKSHKKQIVIGALAVCVIGGALTFNLTRAKYKITESIDLAKGTINYKPYDFKIMAMYQSEDGSNYTEINDMPSNGYTINEDKSYCTTDNKVQVKGKIYINDSGELVLKNLTKSDKCYLYFDKQKLGADQILANITSKSTTPTTFANGATTDEGVFSVSDTMYGGTSYYWRGAVTNNYVQFVNFCWRIIRINGDKTIRLIYDGTTCHANGTSTTESIAVASIAYNTLYDQSNYVGWTYTGTSQRTTSGTASNAKSQLESWYGGAITESSVEKVAQGKYCNDRNVQSGNTWAINGSTFYYAAYKRIITEHSPSLACPTGDIYTLNVGLITVDEAMYAGGTNANNTSYYLYNGQNYYTMSPSYWRSDNSRAYTFSIDVNGNLANYRVNTGWGLRPVINLRSDVTLTGNGTIDNPYVVQ